MNRPAVPEFSIESNDTLMKISHKTFISGFLGASFFIVANHAAAVTVQFEGVAPPGGFTVPVCPYTESGFTLNATEFNNGIFSSTSSFNHNGNTTDFFAFDPPNVITLTAVGGNLFDFTSLSASTLDINGAPYTLNIAGFVGGINTVNQSLSVTSTWQNFTLTGFTIVDSVKISGPTADPFGPAIDNLAVTAVTVPEPTTFCLIGFGIAAVGLCAARRLRL